MTGLEEVRRSRSRREAEQQALVLAAMGIGSQLVAGPGGVEIHVAATDAEAARGQLEAYERENAARRPATAVAPRTDLEGWPASAVYAMVLLFFFGAERRDLGSVDWLAAGAPRPARSPAAPGGARSPR